MAALALRHVEAEALPSHNVDLVRDGFAAAACPSNGRDAGYGADLAAMIAEWRSDWGAPGLPFGIVQLPAGQVECVAPRPV